ncbi:MAG: hypothetical protein IPL61_18485 [Myxococcales bacterium]|nr:hypothetical protein [Myxococcales bacterium]
MLLARVLVVLAACGLAPMIASAQDVPDAGAAAPTAAPPAAGEPAAQPAPPPDPAAPQVPPTADQPPVPPVAAAPMCTIPPKDNREARAKFRLACATAIEEDADWQADITNRFERRGHEQAAKKIVTNERHVFLAYGLIWVLVAGLVGVMWMRQQNLSAEIARLTAQLKRIEAEDAAKAAGKGGKGGKGPDGGAAS